MRKRAEVFVLGTILGMGMTGAIASIPAAYAQATVSTGSIEGTVLDPRGGTVADAKITVTNKGTSQELRANTSSSGAYNVAALAPGSYLIRVEAKGFKTVQIPVLVQIGIVTPVNITLEVGSEAIVINVEATVIAVNTEQATVQDVITSQQIEQLPVDGRNFLDLAQLAPGVQIQDGSTFDPTKNGFSSISFG